MVRDSVVGILGVLVIVGSMGVLIETQLRDSSADATTNTDGNVQAATVNASVWRTQNCQTASLYWEPSTSDLEPHTGPHEPRSTGSGGMFWLFAYDCPDSTVNGVATDGASGAGAFALVEEPDDTRNVSAEDGWVATLEWITNSDDRTRDALERKAFNVNDGTVTIDTTNVLQGRQISVTIETSEGSLTGDALITGAPSTRTVERAYVNVREDPFGVAHGPLTETRQTTGSGTVQTSGTTWVERLGLQPTPSSIAFAASGSWNYTITREPTNATGNQTQSVLTESPSLLEPASSEALRPSIPGIRTTS